jgi:hypothetical protein
VALLAVAAADRVTAIWGVTFVLVVRTPLFGVAPRAACRRPRRLPAGDALVLASTAARVGS